MRARRLETVVQFVSDPRRSKEWYTRLLGVEPTPYEGPYFKKFRLRLHSPGGTAELFMAEAAG